MVERRVVGDMAGQPLVQETDLASQLRRVDMQWARKEQ